MNKSKEVLFVFDIVYNGDVNKWMCFVNLLMFCLVICVCFVDVGFVKEYVEKVVKYFVGLINSKELVV